MPSAPPTPALTARLEQYRSAAVRDLVWAILSPALIVTPGNTQHSSPAWYEQAYQSIEPHLQQLDQDESALIQHLTTPHIHRLGTYFERLWSYWLQHNGRYALLAANLQVARDNQTLGEFDLIVRDTHADEIEHWELAVKFYLGVPPLEHPQRWFGPHHQDRLDLKYHHLVERQLPLSQTHAGQQACASHGWTIARRRLICKGRLYFPGTDADPPSMPRITDPQALHGRWLTHTEFQRQSRRFPDARYRRLNRDEWLVSRADPLQRLTEIQPDLSRTHPIQLEILGWHEQPLRLFLVPDTWPQQALATLPG